MLILSHYCDISLNKEISRFWELEDIPRNKHLSPSDQFCENLYTTTTKRSKDGRYIVSLPFKETPIKIGRSRNTALAQFYKNEARLLRNPEFKTEYDKVLEEYRSLNHMSQVVPHDDSNIAQDYYLPHHAVVKPESTTTKIRVVFNASSPTSSGQSLKDCLHTGPKCIDKFW